MEKKRTEEEIIAQADIEVILGGQKYQIKPLTIKYSRPWRAKVIELLSTLPKQLGATSDSPDDFESAFKNIAITMPDKVVDLFFEYARDLNQEDIEEVALESELAKAFNQIIEVAFPLVKSLPETMGKLSA